MLTQIIYVSTAVQPFTPEALRNLLLEARARNAAQEITGLLLYDRGMFLQVLEGPEPNVEAVFGSIRRDARHRAIQMLERFATEERVFRQWAMGFVDVGSGQRRSALPGGWEDLTTGRNPGERALRYMELFQPELYGELT